MRKRFRVFCIPLLFVLLLFSFETRADVAIPTWGKVIKNDCHFNIEIEGSDITIHQRVEMKLKKFISYDYLYTFTTSSAIGRFDESSLSVITPPSGLKDSIFDQGCKLEYLSEVALEETLEVAFEYQYKYSEENIGEILYDRWLYSRVIDNDEFICITSNQEIEVKMRGSSWPDWRTIGKGTRISYYPPSWVGILHLKICMPTSGRTDELKEKTSFELVPERRQQMPNLIKEEFITIELEDTLDDMYHYHLSGTIELDLETATQFDPFYAWFPNEQTNASVTLASKYEFYSGDTAIWYDTSMLKVKPSVFEGQNGFYILIPLMSDSTWWSVWACRKATLLIEIDGIQSERSCDFILVTAPQELSFVEFKIPTRFYFETCFSPFEHEATYYENGFHVKGFYGECLTTGVAHVEWRTSLYPEYDFILSQNYPNPFNQKTVIRYSLPRDCAVKLSVYNLLGERVKTLVNERQSANDYQVEWDGKNEEGQDVASGIYLYKIDIGESTDRRKMVIIK